MLLAAEPRRSAPKPIDFQMNKATAKRSPTSSMMAASSTLSQEKALKRQKQEEAKAMKEAIKNLKKSFNTLHSKLERVGKKDASLSVVNIELIKNLTKIIQDFKLLDQPLAPAPLPPITTSTTSTSTLPTTSSTPTSTL